MDPESARLVLQLQLEDIGAFVDGSHHKQDDELAAFNIMRDILEESLELADSQCFALNLLRTDRKEWTTFVGLIHEEQQAEQDHELACRLHGTQVPVPQHSYRPESIMAIDSDDERHIEEVAQTTTSISSAYDADSDEERGESSNPIFKGKGKATSTAATHTECVACLETKPNFDMLHLNCQPTPHAYCRDCILDLFESSLTDTSLFPPRCCRIPISLVDCEPFFTRDFVDRFIEKRIELNTSNPTYCSSVACGQFIRPEFYSGNRDIATCPKCQHETCRVCKTHGHQGLCPEDPTTQPFMDTAHRNMWMQCRSCKHMVELESGCYHMTCRCGAQFCYLCGSKWKTCSCPQFEERGLLGNMRRRRSSAAPPVRLPTRALPMPERAPSIAASESGDAECEHNWNRRYYRDGANTTCELCVNTNHLPFIEECRRCDRRLCLRCINNRI